MKNARRGLAVMCVAAFMVPFMGSAINLALPRIASHYSMNGVTLTWMATAYLISTAIFQIPFARIADLVGRRKVFTAGIIIFSICTLLCGFTATSAQILTLRFLAGIGSAMVFGTNIAIITSLFPAEKRGYALGINAAVVYAALAAGPFLGGIITDFLGWKSIFYITAGIGAVVVVLTHLFIKEEWVESRGGRFDVAGSILYGIGLASLIYGFSTLPVTGGYIAVVVGIALLVLFVLVEMRSSQPVLQVRLFASNKVFALSSFAALVNYAATSAIAFMISLYLQYVKGFEPASAGLILITQAIVQSAFSLFSGKLSDCIEPSRLATLGMFLTVAGLVGLIFISAESSVPMLIVMLVFLGAGFGIFSSPNTNVIMSSVEKSQYTQASAVTGTMRLAGQSFSMGIAAMAISFYFGDKNLDATYSDWLISAMRLTFAIFAVLCTIGVFASRARGK